MRSVLLSRAVRQAPSCAAFHAFLACRAMLHVHACDVAGRRLVFRQRKPLNSGPGAGLHTLKQQCHLRSHKQPSSSAFPSRACGPTDQLAVAVEAGSGSGGGDGSVRRFFGGGGNGPDDNPSSGASTHLLPQLLAVLVAVLLPALTPATASAAAAASKRSSLVSHQDEKLVSSWQLDAFVDRMWDLSGPLMQNMGFSGLLGACSAAALKWVGRTLAASLGMGLVLIQVLSYYNVITVNWSVVHQQARVVLDTTGDGRLDQDDFKRFVKQGLVVLSEGVPSVSGFLVGFLVGLKVF